MDAIDKSELPHAEHSSKKKDLHALDWVDPNAALVLRILVRIRTTTYKVFPLPVNDCMSVITIPAAREGQERNGVTGGSFSLRAKLPIGYRQALIPRSC